MKWYIVLSNASASASFKTRKKIVGLVESRERESLALVGFIAHLSIYRVTARYVVLGWVFDFTSWLAYGLILWEEEFMEMDHIWDWWDGMVCVYECMHIWILGNFIYIYHYIYHYHPISLSNRSKRAASRERWVELMFGIWIPRNG